MDIAPDSSTEKDSALLAELEKRLAENHKKQRQNYLKMIGEGLDHWLPALEVYSGSYAEYVSMPDEYRNEFERAIEHLRNVSDWVKGERS